MQIIWKKKVELNLEGDSFDNQYTCKHILYFAAEQIKDRLVYLRGYYSKELGKHTKSKKNSSSSDDVYNSGWKYFKKFDSFLKSQIIPRASKTNMVSNSAPPPPGTPLLSSAESFQNELFLKNFFRNLSRIRVSNSLDPDQVRRPTFCE